MAPVIARIKARPKIIRTRFRVPRGRGVRIQAAWEPERKAKRPTGAVGRVFRPQFDIDPAYLKTVKDFGQEWQGYLQQLEQFFVDFPEAAGYYPEYYSYWLKWRGWWNRISGPAKVP